MKLSELKTGEHGIIVKVTGHGGFRKRIIEMGFIKGKEVQVLLNAPLQDPVKYRIMGYEVSLRHSEASHIEVVTHEEAPLMDKEKQQVIIPTDEEQQEKAEKTVHREALKRRREINVALVGNPNCGKTSLFNFASGAHERVGNYSGVTVDAKEGIAEFKGYRFHVVDLPGTYSLSAYSPEELYEMCRIAREILTGKHNVARVIARPYVWEDGKYVRTANRRDFSRKPDEKNLLNMIKDSGQTVYAVGKIEDIFAGVGITEAIHTKDNEDGMDKTIEALDIVENGLIFTNLVEFDSTWGHRRDVDGYAHGLEAFDKRLGELMNRLGSYKGKESDDIIVITADHGCDPTFKGTDHTREYVPLLVYGKSIEPGVNLGTTKGFAHSGEMVKNFLFH